MFVLILESCALLRDFCGVRSCFPIFAAGNYIMIKLAIPLCTSQTPRPPRFLLQSIGFKSNSPLRRPDHARPCYVGISRDGVWPKHCLFSGDGYLSGVANLFVDNVDDLYKIHGQGVQNRSRPGRQDLGLTAKCTLKDADGICLRSSDLSCARINIERVTRAIVHSGARFVINAYTQSLSRSSFYGAAPRIRKSKFYE